MKYIISIPEPCSEKWSEMTPTEKGRYCAVCQREIYDFTKLTHRQLAQRLKRNENVCGVFRKDQLDVDLYAGLDFDLQKLGTVATISTILLTSQATLAQSNPTLFIDFI